MTIKNTLKLSLITATIVVSANAQSTIDRDDLPPAKPGQCFTKAFFPAKYATTTERVLVSEATEEVKVIPMGQGNKNSRILAWRFES